VPQVRKIHKNKLIKTPSFLFYISELMHLRKRSTILIIVLTVFLLLLGLLVDFPVTNKTTAATHTFPPISFDMGPASENSRNVTADEPDSQLNITLESDGKLQFYIEFNGTVEYFKYEKQLTNYNFRLRQQGEWSVHLRNNSSQSLHVQYSMTLKVFYNEIERPYTWLRIPAFILGLIVLSLIIPINFYDTVKKKWNRTITEILVFSIIAILVLGHVLILGAVLRTSTPLVYTNTPSMEPTIWPGDLVIVAGEDPKNLAEGDIILYNTITLNLTTPDLRKMSTPIMHRIKGIMAQGGIRYFITKGDNNNKTDEWYVPEEGVIGKAIYIVPYVGSIISALQRVEIKILIIALVIIAIIIWPDEKTKLAKPKDEKK
jgi:signal peptidase I